MPRVEHEKLTDRREGECSAVVRERVPAARQRQSQRFAGTRITCNADMGPAEVRQHRQVDAAAQPLLRAAIQRLLLSARAFQRVLKLARTIADLADAETHRRATPGRGHPAPPAHGNGGVAEDAVRGSGALFDTAIGKTPTALVLGRSSSQPLSALGSMECGAPATPAIRPRSAV